MSRSTAGVILLVATVALAGCMGGGGSADVQANADPGGQATVAAEGAPEARNSAPSGADRATDRSGNDGPPSVAPRKLVRTGTVKLEVQDFDAARRSLVGEARSVGGFVGDSSRKLHREDNRTWTTGRVVLRVPADEFPTVLAAVREQGTVVSERTKTRDVTDQLVDLEARLENLRSKRSRLREFYERANTTRGLLRIEERLSAVQRKIERLKAQKRALERKVAYSTLTVKLREPEPDPTPTPTPTPSPAYHETSLGAALASSLGSLVVLGRGLLVTLAYALPYAVVAGVPAGAVGLWWHRERR